MRRVAALAIVSTLVAAALIATRPLDNGEPQPPATAPPPPVVAIHGFSDCSIPLQVEAPWAFLAERLDGRLVAISYYECDSGGARVGSFTQRAAIRSIAAAVAQWIEETFGRQPVDLVGHSMGGLIARLVATDPDIQVRRGVTLSTPHGGFAEPICPSRQCEEMVTGSAFLAWIGHPSGSWTVAGSRDCDSVPYASAIALRDAEVLTYECVNHLEYLLTEAVLADTAEALSR